MKKETIIYSPYKLSDIMIVSPFWAFCWGVKLTCLEIRLFDDSFQFAYKHAFSLVFTNTKRTNGMKIPVFPSIPCYIFGLYDAMVSTHTAFLLFVEDESYSTSADEKNKQIKALKRRNSIGVGAPHVALIFFLQERHRSDIILTYPNPPQGRVILIVLMYINSPLGRDGVGLNYVAHTGLVNYKSSIW